jgi:hypothetical protein
MPCHTGRTRSGFPYVSETSPAWAKKNHGAALPFICIGPSSAGGLLQRSFVLLADMVHAALYLLADGEQASAPGKAWHGLVG